MTLLEAQTRISKLYGETDIPDQNGDDWSQRTAMIADAIDEWHDDQPDVRIVDGYPTLPADEIGLSKPRYVVYWVLGQLSLLDESFGVSNSRFAKADSLLAAMRLEDIAPTRNTDAMEGLGY